MSAAEVLDEPQAEAAPQVEPSLEEAMEFLWQNLAPLLIPALDRMGGLHSLDTVWERIKDGRAQMWPGLRSILITELVEYPHGLGLRLWLAGGELEETKRLHDQACEWGKAQGCTFAEIVGRRGWLRTMPGYREIARVAVRSL